MSVLGSPITVLRDSTEFPSVQLKRKVLLDFYIWPKRQETSRCPVLLINDGQDLRTIGFEKTLSRMWEEGEMAPFLAVGIHAGKDRRMEYGTSGEPDYLGRGASAAAYQNFILNELLPHIQQSFPTTREASVSFAGFSLGGLSALDITWSHPEIFRSAGVFSGSFWWRSVDQESPLYSDDKHRIMHQRIRRGTIQGEQQFFFQCGALDEEKDRNRNGIIDSIDDTLDLIDELVHKGVPRATHIYYLELADGRHDVESWGRAIPYFLRWNFR